MKGCCQTAVIRRGCVTAKPAPSIVTTILAKTSAYVRRTSVARSTPLRTPIDLTARLYEKPMASSDYVGESTRIYTRYGARRAAPGLASPSGVERAPLRRAPAGILPVSTARHFH